MKRAAQLTEISGDPYRQAPDAVNLVPLPPVDWYVKGPRGGRYIATGRRTRSVGELDFLRDMMAVVDKSEGLRYLRPGSRAWKDAETA